LEKFLNKIFPEDLSYCKENRIGEFYGCIAARFALKEAFIKAFSKLDIKILFSDIKIIGGGKNLKVEFSEKLQNILKEKNINLKFDFSISHERKYSVATVILYIDED
ncbi:MAG TPA: 4'-phosphopantetheinyl transferase superfamily protein, partial [Aquificae bacterium]|nr:4'-phosphopantetheinyl transferase superfamily protein [Aquificota bacterium]